MKRSLTYIILSFLCPVAAVIGVSVYQEISNADFWNNLTPDYSFVGATMAVGELIQLMFSLLIGCVIGLIFSGLYLSSPRKIKALGIAAVTYNCLPFLLLGILLFAKP